MSRRSPKSPSDSNLDSHGTLFGFHPEKGPPEIKFEALHHRIWTKNKARLVERYLYYFLFITHHGTYIDGFAGQQDPGKPDSWTAKRVVELEPRWLRHLFLGKRDHSCIICGERGPVRERRRPCFA